MTQYAYAIAANHPEQPGAAVYVGVIEASDIDTADHEVYRRLDQAFPSGPRGRWYYKGRAIQRVPDQSGVYEYRGPGVPLVDTRPDNVEGLRRVLYLYRIEATHTVLPGDLRPRVASKLGTVLATSLEVALSKVQRTLRETYGGGDWYNHSYEIQPVDEGQIELHGTPEPETDWSGLGPRTGGPNGQR